MPLFDSLSNTQRSLIASSLEPVSFDGGDVIFEEGDHGDYFFIVEAGGVKVIKQRATTGEIVLTEIGAGGYFGELALLRFSSPCHGTAQGYGTWVKAYFPKQIYL